METTTSAALLPATVLALSSAIVLRRGFSWMMGRYNRQYEYESEDEYVEGEEELLPQPEPLGGSLAPPKRAIRPPVVDVPLSTLSPKQRPVVVAAPRSPSPSVVSFAHERLRQELPLDQDAATLRAKLIDADAAKRRALTRLAELERETESLKHRCAELERRVINDGIQSLGKLMSDNIQSLGISQRLLTLAVPQLKYRGRGLLWS